MTQYEFHTMVANCDALTDEVRAISIAFIEKENAKREAKAQERAEELTSVIDFIGGLEEDAMFCAKDVAAATGFTSQKASNLLKGLVQDGSIVKVPNSAAPVQYTKA